MEVNEFGSVIEVNEEQPLNSPEPMEVTESGIVIEVKSEFSLKARPPIEVTELGIVIEENEQPEKALDLIEETLFPNDTEANLSQEKKVKFSMIVTESGRLIEDKTRQSEKALFPMN